MPSRLYFKCFGRAQRPSPTNTQTTPDLSLKNQNKLGKSFIFVLLPSLLFVLLSILRFVEQLYNHTFKGGFIGIKFNKFLALLRFTFNISDSVKLI